MTTKKETIILEKLSHNETPVRQRELAEVAGLSLGSHVLQTFQADREMDTAFVSGQGMDLVQNHDMRCAQYLARFGAGEQKIE